MLLRDVNFDPLLFLRICCDRWDFVVESPWKGPERPLSIERDWGGCHPKPGTQGGGPRETSPASPAVTVRRWKKLSYECEMEEIRDKLASESFCFSLMRPDRLVRCLLGLAPLPYCLISAARTGHQGLTVGPSSPAAPATGLHQHIRFPPAPFPTAHPL